MSRAVDVLLVVSLTGHAVTRLHVLFAHKPGNCDLISELHFLLKLVGKAVNTTSEQGLN